MSIAAYRDLKLRGGVIFLSDRVKLILTGGDRVRYLNGQVTSNVTTLLAGHTQQACVTTAKGRLCAEIVITALSDRLLIDADPALRESLPSRLERYIVADDVELQDATEDWRLLHILPPLAESIESAEATLRPHFAALPIQRARRFGRTGLDIFLPPADIETLSALEASYTIIPPALAETVRIEAGIPRWGHELGEDTLPPEAGLEATHIDYHKGCYVGQEVISRLKSVGHVNRNLTGFLSDDGAPLSAGMIVFSTEGSGSPVGTLTSAARSFALEKPIALGYLKRGSPSTGLIARPADTTGAEVRLSVRTLPFVS